VTRLDLPISSRKGALSWMTSSAWAANATDADGLGWPSWPPRSGWWRRGSSATFRLPVMHTRVLRRSVTLCTATRGKQRASPARRPRRRSCAAAQPPRCRSRAPPYDRRVSSSRPRGGPSDAGAQEDNERAAAGQGGLVHPCLRIAPGVTVGRADHARRAWARLEPGGHPPDLGEQASAAVSRLSIAACGAAGAMSGRILAMKASKPASFALSRPDARRSSRPRSVSASERIQISRTATPPRSATHDRHLSRSWICSVNGAHSRTGSRGAGGRPCSCRCPADQPPPRPSRCRSSPHGTR
jgi:hypothetical protein